MPYWSTPFYADWPQLTLRTIADVVITAFLIYQFLMVLRGRRAAAVLVGLAMMVAIYLGAVYLELTLLRGVLETVAPYSVFGLIVMFNTELRMALSRLGQLGWYSSSGRLKRREFAEEILLALEAMSHRKIGALIVLERDLGLRTFVESGVPTDAIVSRDLLLAIFHPNAALHDGGVIVQNGRIAAAACFLPLATDANLLSTVGTRHRAALGITEDTDCLSLIVSEETGQISVAAFGEMSWHLRPEEVRHRIEHHFGWSGPRAERKERGAATSSAPGASMGESVKPVSGAD